MINLNKNSMVVARQETRNDTLFEYANKVLFDINTKKAIVEMVYQNIDNLIENEIGSLETLIDLLKVIDYKASKNEGIEQYMVIGLLKHYDRLEVEFSLNDFYINDILAFENAKLVSKDGNYFEIIKFIQ